MISEQKEYSPRDRAAMDKADREAYQAKVQAAHAPTADRNRLYFEAQEKRAEEARLANKRNAANQPKPQTNAQAAAKHAAAYPYRPWQKGDLDPLASAEPRYVQEQLGYVPVEIKPSLVAKMVPIRDYEKETAIARHRAEQGQAPQEYHMMPRDVEASYVEPERPASPKQTVTCPQCGEVIPSGQLTHNGHSALTNPNLTPKPEVEISVDPTLSKRQAVLVRRLAKEKK